MKAYFDKLGKYLKPSSICSQALKRLIDTPYEKRELGS